MLETGAQASVTLDDSVERSLQSVYLQRPAQAQHQRRVISRAGGLLQQPHPLLGKRGRRGLRIGYKRNRSPGHQTMALQLRAQQSAFFLRERENAFGAGAH